MDAKMGNIIKNATDKVAMPVGSQVVKTSGYSFPGEVRSVFLTKSGDQRFVVEATGADYAGMLHIFNAGQLSPLPRKDEE